MAKQIKLKDQNGDDLVIQDGESMNIIATFSDVSSTPETLASTDILTISLTLFAGTTAINSRSAQSVLNANNGTLASDGTLTIALGPLDSVIVGTVSAGATETHIARLVWTWNDGAARTGIAEYTFEVEQTATIA